MPLFERPAGPCDGSRTAAWRRHDNSSTRPAARQMSHALGFMCAMTGRSAARRLRRRCFIIRVTVGGEHPQAHLAEYAGILQADAYGGYGKLYDAGRSPGVILEAGCWAHARRKFFVLADVEIRGSTKGAEQAASASYRRCAWKQSSASTSCSTLRRDINGRSADQRRAVRQELSAPLVG
ncbi:MAG: transposase [Rhodospirillales bacterium]